jgi:hypothetical protein
LHVGSIRQKTTFERRTHLSFPPFSWFAFIQQAAGPPRI